MSVNRTPQAYIAGAFEHPTRKAVDKTVAQLHAEVAAGALADAGLTKDDVDGFFCAGDAPGLGGLSIAEYMGLNVDYIDTTETGGSSYVVHVGHAAQAIAAGRCSVALVTLAGRPRADGQKSLGVRNYGDGMPDIGPFRNPGMGAIFLNANRSKRSIVLDLKQADGLAAAFDLIKRADVLLYNIRPQTMERLGLSYEAVRAVNDGIIYAGLYGYGQDGPYAARPAFDDLIQGAIGIPALAQAADGREPAYAPTAIVDRGVALWAVGQVNAALFHRERTGQGQRLDIPMFEMMASFALADHMSGRTFEPPLGPTGYPRMLNPDRRPYKTKDGYVCAMVYTDRHWRSFFKALGREAEFAADPRFRDMSTRTENIVEIYRELGELFTTKTTAEWLDLLDAADIPVAPMHSPDTLMDDPHLQAVGFFSMIDHPSEGRLCDMAVPGSWSETQPKASRHAPQLGEHSFEVLRELGYGEQQISNMIERGATVLAGMKPNTTTEERTA